MITIGEIVNKLLDYCNNVEANISNGVPFLKARISSNSCYTKCYMYVVQTAPHVYAACDYHDDVCGSRFFPTGSETNPFIVEQDVIHRLFGCGEGMDNSWKYETVTKDLDPATFNKYLIGVLSAYEIIRFDQRKMDQKVAELGFTSTRIKRVIEKEFDTHRCHQGTINDLYDIINERHEVFSLANLRQRESSVILAKMRELGVTLSIDSNNCIASFKFDKKKE